MKLVFVLMLIAASQASGSEDMRSVAFPFIPGNGVLQNVPVGKSAKIQEYDRDILAANNIKRFALTGESLRYSGQGLPGEPADVPSLEGRMKQEASHDAAQL